MTAYKLFFLDADNKIVVAEDEDSADDAAVCDLAAQRLGETAHAAVEVWCGARKVTVLKRAAPKVGGFRHLQMLVSWFRA